MRALLSFVLSAAAVLAWSNPADETYLGLFLQGQRIGYSAYLAKQDTLDGKTVQRSDSTTVMRAGLLGSAMTITIASTTWSDPNGRPIRMTTKMTSAGRTQHVEARFGPAEVKLTVDNNGQKTNRTLKIPTDAPIADDPMATMVQDGLPAGTSKSFYILDPTTVSFIKNEARVVGPREVDVRGEKRQATLVEIVDPRANTRVFLSSKGDVLKVEGPMGIEMFPEPKEVALAEPAPGYRPSVDLAFATSLKPDQPITDPDRLKTLKLRITGRDLSRVPSDAHQTVRKDGEAWVVEVHPLSVDVTKSATIEEARKQKPEWAKPSLHVSSEAPAIRKLAREIVGDRKTVREAGLAVRRWVYENMRANAGIGVLRDATEVLSTREGVCRDYAILSAALLRSVGVPTRLASGLVNWDGTFYYHAWVEVWDGARWLALDGTAREDQVSAAHVKLAEGNVEDAFAFTFLDRVRVEVLGFTRR